MGAAKAMDDSKDRYPWSLVFFDFISSNSGMEKGNAAVLAPGSTVDKVDAPTAKTLRQKAYAGRRISGSGTRECLRCS